MRLERSGEALTATMPRGLLSTTTITVLLGPIAGLLWIGRGRLALGLFAGSLIFLPLVLWRLYEGDPWAGWFGPLATNDLIQWIVFGVLGLVLVLPIRESSLPIRWYSRGWGTAAIVAALSGLSLTVALAVRSFVVQPFSIAAASMQPNLMEGDYVLASKRAYGYGPYSVPLGPWLALDGERIAPARGDIAIFRFPPNPSVDYVYRVIGLPGDTVQLVAGIVQINGIPVRTEAVAAPAQMDGLVEPGTVFGRETLPEGRSYVIQNLIDGSVGDDTGAFVVPLGHYFMMGDNRDNSADSRFNTGYVPEENLVGKVEVIFWNRKGIPFDNRRFPGSQ